jgi:predicted enzyme related to lactoylglutathione lyase
MAARHGVFNHLFISPADWDRSVKFYRDVLGWSIEHDWGDQKAGRGVSLRSQGGMQVVLVENYGRSGEPGGRGGAVAHQPTACVSVPDVDELFRSLSDRSCVVVPPQDTHWGRWVIVRDPDGNLVAFVRSKNTDPGALWV